MARKPVARAAVIEVASDTIPLTSALSEFLTFHRQKGSSELYVRQLEYFLGRSKKKQAAKWSPLVAWCFDNKIESLSELDKPTITKWLAYIRTATTEDTHFKATECLRRLLRYCVDEGYLKELPMRLVRPKVERKEIPIFTEDEVSRLAAVVKNENPRDWAIFMLMLDTGIRASELVGIQTSDIYWNREELLIRGKGHKQRIVQVHGSLNAMTKYRRIRPETDRCDAFFLSFPPGRSPVFANQSQSRRKRDRYAFAAAAMTRKGLLELVTKWGKLAGITEARCSPHTFRHYYAVQFMRKGGQLHELQKLLGHSKIETVLIYAKLAAVDIKKAARRFSPALDILPARLHTIDVA